MPAATAIAPQAFVLSCIDYRLTNDVDPILREEGLSEAYDQFALAGASLGACLPERPHWAQTFFEHLDIAVSLLHPTITEVIVLDHLHCGAYQTFADDRVETHRLMIERFAAEVSSRFPRLSVEGFLMEPVDEAKATWRRREGFRVFVPARERLNG